MWNPFKKTQDKFNLHIDFELINNIYQHLDSVKNPVFIEVKDQIGTVKAAWFNFPKYYTTPNHEILKKHGFDNLYEVLNQKYAAANINTLSIEEAIENDDQYTILEFSFDTTPDTKDEKLYYKRVIRYFYVILVRLDNSEVNNDLRVFFTRFPSIYSSENFINTKYIENINNPEDNDLKYVEAFERNLVALSQHLKLPISAELQKKYPDSLLLGNVTEQDLKRVMELINYNTMGYDLDQIAKDLFADYQANWGDLNEEVDFPTAEYFPKRFDVLFEENYWFTDWKFDPEDADEFIEDILDEEWCFEYPAETYSHDLFPYIQEALAKKELELMDLDCEGDSYCFFVVQKKDVQEVLNLSQKLKIGLTKLIY
jgi:hypothetical protein